MTDGQLQKKVKSESKTDFQMTDPLWTIEDVARYLRISEDTVRSMARESKIPALKVGKSWRFKKSMIYQFVMEQLGKES